MRLPFSYQQKLLWYYLHIIIIILNYYYCYIIQYAGYAKKNITMLYYYRYANCTKEAFDSLNSKSFRVEVITQRIL